MRISGFLYLSCIFLAFTSCKQTTDQQVVSNKEYFDVIDSDDIQNDPLIAVTNSGSLEIGSPVAYVDPAGDTIIPFGNFAYSGSDTLARYANVIKLNDDGTLGEMVAINSDQKILFDVVLFDNGLDYFYDGLTRVKRNGKMGYANDFGQIVIPCIYEYAKPFNNGKATVTLKTKPSADTDEHKTIESDEWFEIDTMGNKIE